MPVPHNQHILIENVTPSVDGGRYACKAVVGETCVVEADIFRDGIEPIEAQLLWKHEADSQFSATSLQHIDNDRWRGSFKLDRPGRTTFTIRGRTFTNGVPAETVLEPALAVEVDRPLAAFGAWYEMFVRSQGKVAGQGGTFKDAETRLPDIKNMGFDVIYLAPIHPVGRTARKGPNNNLKAGPEDPGSPWAIGNENGGHDAIEPALGTLADFDHFVAAAGKLGLEVALDFAPHCSPDHPWVKNHADWFYRRPDGTIKCHENPPFVYEDVYPLNFDSKDADSLFEELLNVFLFWVGHGVKIFRIDNPHTKPVAFWEWVIREVRKKHPEVIFLGEAFTRPKMMKTLSKAGFTQSYTYFMWRNSKQELSDYMMELSSEAMRLYFRPNFFPTTPDVLPPVLQNAGASAFKMRLALAALLSPSYGIINGYELCENKALPGTEEYADSEKYENKVRDYNQSGHIKEFIVRLNAVRRANPAFQSLRNFYLTPIENDQLLGFVNFTADKSNVIIGIINLDPHQPQQGMVRIPWDKLGMSGGASFGAEELFSGSSHQWSDNNFVRIDPAVGPAQIFRIKR